MKKEHGQPPSVWRPLRSTGFLMMWRYVACFGSGVGPCSTSKACELNLCYVRISPCYGLKLLACIPSLAIGMWDLLSIATGLCGDSHGHRYDHFYFQPHPSVTLAKQPLIGCASGLLSLAVEGVVGAQWVPQEASWKRCQIPGLAHLFSSIFHRRRSVRVVLGGPCRHVFHTWSVWVWLNPQTLVNVYSQVPARRKSQDSGGGWARSPFARPGGAIPHGGVRDLPLRPSGHLPK